MGTADDNLVKRDAWIQYQIAIRQALASTCGKLRSVDLITLQLHAVHCDPALIRKFSHITEMDPREDGAWFELGVLQRFAAQDRAALAALIQASSIDPDNSAYAVMMGRLCEHVHGVCSAQQVYSDVLSKNPSLIYTRWFSDLLSRDPSLAKTSEQVAEDTVLIQSRSDPIVLAKMGWFSLYHGDAASAFSEFVAATHSLPSLGHAWLGTAVSEMILGNYSQAHLAFQRAAFLGSVLDAPYQTSRSMRVAQVYGIPGCPGEELIPTDLKQYLSIRTEYVFSLSANESRQ